VGRTRCCSHRPTKDVLGIAIGQRYTEGCNTIRRLDHGAIFRGYKIDRVGLPGIQKGLPPRIRPATPLDDQRDAADCGHLAPICPRSHVRIQRLIPGGVHTARIIPCPTIARIGRPGWPGDHRSHPIGSCAFGDITTPQSRDGIHRRTGRGIGAGTGGRCQGR
jgi:hypothetical protein